MSSCFCFRDSVPTIWPGSHPPHAISTEHPFEGTQPTRVFSCVCCPASPKIGEKRLDTLENKKSDGPEFACNLYQVSWHLMAHNYDAQSFFCTLHPRITPGVLGGMHNRLCTCQGLPLHCTLTFKNWNHPNPDPGGRGGGACQNKGGGTHNCIAVDNSESKACVLNLHLGCDVLRTVKSGLKIRLLNLYASMLWSCTFVSTKQALVPPCTMCASDLMEAVMFGEHLQDGHFRHCFCPF